MAYNLDKAIPRVKEIVAIWENNDKVNKTLGKDSLYRDIDCAKHISEYRQLAEWLEELKAYREIGTVEGYKSAIECYTEEYNRRKNNEQYNKTANKCGWKEDAYGRWHTGCNILADSSPLEYAYCPYCGKKIRW